MIFEKERQKRTSITKDDLQHLSNAELNEHMTLTRANITNILQQITLWKAGQLAEHWDDNWRDKAGFALSHNQNALAFAKVELAKRSTHPTPPSGPRDVHHAFMRAAKAKLGMDEIKQIWELARELYPEIFANEI